jgi:GNAT superfamily N-acetyltransferase
MPAPEGATIRRAEVADAERVARLQLDCWDDAYTGLVPQEVLDEGRRTLRARIRTWGEILADGRRTTLLAEGGDGAAAGFAGSGPPRDDDVGPDLDLQLDLELYAIYVRAAWWGSGLGHALLEEAVGDRPAYLWVVEGNSRATAFYERQGFRLDGRTKTEPEGLHLRMVRP